MVRDNLTGIPCQVVVYWEIFKTIPVEMFTPDLQPSKLNDVRLTSTFHARESPIGMSTPPPSRYANELLPPAP
jgi:hypothetical protein